MRIIHIIGRQKNGKTTLIVDLISEFIKRGIRVGTLKHSSHSHELDKPGKDSYLHRIAGACPAAIATKDLMAVYLPKKPGANPFDQLEILFDKTDLILVEGYISGPGKKIEVWRKSVGTAPLFMERNDIEAVITNDVIATTLPVWPRKDIADIADNIMKLVSMQQLMKNDLQGVKS
ncbi:MAG: molybdopterin-guanine dinucleotide biosynthesis protein B [Desulfobacteraceae bacterium]|nr:MAG: molybdopterin-guanine dinucleotide biosynthesis protein B [Desulfobacteraceae bacterium]